MPGLRQDLVKTRHLLRTKKKGGGGAERGMYVNYVNDLKIN